MLGYERMKIQGFRQMRLSGIGPCGEHVEVSDADLSTIAGNTMAVSAIGFIEAVTLANVRFEPPGPPGHLIDADSIEAGVDVPFHIGDRSLRERIHSTLLDRLPGS